MTAQDLDYVSVPAADARSGLERVSARRQDPAMGRADATSVGGREWR
jgi:hypothetical protein